MEYDEKELYSELEPSLLKVYSVLQDNLFDILMKHGIKCIKIECEIARDETPDGYAVCYSIKTPQY